MKRDNVMGTQTEYNKLKRMVLGRIDPGNAYPKNDIGMLSVIAADHNLISNDGKTLDLEEAAKLVPEITSEIIDVTQKELAQLESFYKSQGVEVIRPDQVPPEKHIETAHFETTQFPVFCPRDILLNFRDLLIVSPNLYQSRSYESQYYSDILDNERKRGRTVVMAPRPRLRAKDFNLTPTAEYVWNTEDPIFEAANVLIDGEHNALYYQISHSGNTAGYEWLKQIIADMYPDVTVYPLHVYKGTHLDTTIAILNYDTVSLNPERIPDVSILPDPLKNRKHIFPEIIAVQHENGLSSKWIGMNSFSVNPKLVVVDADQELYIEQLGKAGFEVFPHKLTYSDVLEGGHHCTTSDLEREENYS